MLGKLRGVGEERPRLRVQIILRPRGGKFTAQMLIAGKTAHGRRVQPESGGAADFPVDDGRQHFPLKAREGRVASEVKVGIESVEKGAELEVDQGDAEDARHHAAIPPPRHGDGQAAQAARLFGSNRSYAHEILCRKERSPRSPPNAN